MKHRRTRKAPHRKRTRIKRFRATGAATMVVQDGTIIWTLPRKLRSLNTLKNGLARYGDTKTWERLFTQAEVVTSDNSLGPCTNQRLRLEIVRLAPTKQWFLDKVNLYGGCKGLEDALVRLQFLVDDNEAWEDGPYPTQDVSKDGKYWTIVKLSELKPS